MNSYKALSKQIFANGKYSIVPLRMEDRYDIMKWRNEQIYHLRQDRPLTKEDQDKYFETVITNLFEQEKPDQILFSYLEGIKCIGYGGLVHINWIDKNAEISFIMDTQLEKEYFRFHWSSFLKLLEETAFDDLKIYKLYVYAFDLRPHLYTTLEFNHYFKDAVLKDHCLFNDKFIDVVVHSKLNVL
ncbi:GNAT family N-acetyltransferase [Gillisia marina]|uniref:GNAT family N-acetyltransferase n=1 Tax=Gillisia marina TaxID=1167637 RepID=UPI00029B09B9|nr:GNAT family N-acetyltransferase [Gillisia marina]